MSDNEYDGSCSGSGSDTDTESDYETYEMDNSLVDVSEKVKAEPEDERVAKFIGKKSESAPLSAVAQTLLLKDLAYFHKKNDQLRAQGKIPDFEVEPVEDNLGKWKLRMRNFADDSKLYRQMKEKGIDYIQLEIIFPQDYPNEPPFIWLEKPMFKPYTGHVTVDGGICTPLLVTGQKWTNILPLETVFVDLQNMFVDNSGLQPDGKMGEAELDLEDKNNRYSEKSARDGYQRSKNAHGW